MHGLLFFFNDTATTEIYTLSLHDALPIFVAGGCGAGGGVAEPRDRRVAVGQGRHGVGRAAGDRRPRAHRDRKSTRLNSSHANISYAVFCLKKKKIPHYTTVP